MKKLLVLLVLISVVSCKEDQKAVPSDSETEEITEQQSLSPEEALDELFNLMQGSFNSEKQSIADSTYFNISLHMYPIWEDKGKFLYVEQAMNDAQDKPYRQRIYEIKMDDDNTFSSVIHMVPDAAAWVGKWRTPEAFDSLDVDKVMLRKGCDVQLKRLGDNHYKGATQNYTCKSTLRGAVYATSEVEITEDKIISWDRGFDAEGNHVWGAVTGGYIFDKQNN